MARFHGQVRSGDKPGARGKHYQAFVHEGTRFQAGQPYVATGATLAAPRAMADAEARVERALRSVPDGASFEATMTRLAGEVDRAAEGWTKATTTSAGREIVRVAPRLTGALAGEISVVYPARGGQRRSSETGRFN